MNRQGPSAANVSTSRLGILGLMVLLAHGLMVLLAHPGCDRKPAPAPAPSTARGDAGRSQAAAAPASASAVSPAAAASSGSAGEASPTDSDKQRSDGGLAGLSFDDLPLATPMPCAEGGRNTFVEAPPPHWAPIVEAVQSAWPGGDHYGPGSCIGSVRLRCGHDFDGIPGAELLAEIRYRLPMGTAETEGPGPSCSSSERVPQAVIVALSRPSPERQAWISRGIVGFSERGAGEGGTVIRIKRFVRLPDGAVGVSALAFTPGFAARDDVILTYRKEGGLWRTAGTRPLPEAPGAGTAP